MRKSIAIGTGAAVAAVFTHGMVFSGVNLNEPLPISSYQGFFQSMLLATERLWSYANGWQPMSHIQEFGRFYAPTVELICPLIGFALFCILSRYKLGIQVWRPMAIALLLTVTSGFTGGMPGSALPWIEVTRTLLIVPLMLWSMGAIRLSKPHFPATQSQATA